jgi:CcmD family protein
VIRLTAVLLFTLLALATVPVVGTQAQEPNTPAASEPLVAGDVARSAAAEPIYAGVEAGQPFGSAQGTQPPRTLRAHWHVFIAFAITWLLLFGYALSLGRRWASLERQLQRELSQR